MTIVELGEGFEQQNGKPCNVTEETCGSYSCS